MSAFLDDKASESSGDEDAEVVPKKKQRRISTDSEDSEEDESDDEEALAAVQKDFIVPNEAAIEEDEGGDEKKGSDSDAKSSSESDDDLDAEDLDLIEENVGVKIRNKNKKKRRIIMDDSDEEGNDADIQADKVRKTIWGEEDEMGGDDEDAEPRAPEPPIADEEAGSDAEEDEDADEEEDINDFIVDLDGVPESEKRKTKPKIHTDSALQAAQDIFGVDFDFDEINKYGSDYSEEEESDEYEDEELEEGAPESEEKIARRERRRKRAEAAAARGANLYDVFEPDALEKAFFTETDDDIRATDIPERFNTLRHLPVTHAEKEELLEEAEWIYKYAFMIAPISNQDIIGAKTFNDAMNEKGVETVGKIRDALEFMRVHSFEVPFIGMYRKEYVSPELSMPDLWKIFFYDEKWCQLRQRKLKLIELMEKMRKHQVSVMNMDKDLPDNFRLLSDSDLEKANTIESLEELNDVHQHFMLYYGDALEDLRRADLLAEARKTAGDNEEEQKEAEKEALAKIQRRALKKTRYKLCVQAGMGPLALRWGLSAEHFAANLRDQYRRYDVDQCQLPPHLVAEGYVCDQFPTADMVLKGARFMVAQQIAAEPTVRQIVRKAFFEQAHLAVWCTEQGQDIIDENHPLYTVKYLKNKPVNELTADQFLRLTLAENDKLINTVLHMDQLKEDVQLPSRGDLLNDENDSGGSGEYFNMVKDYFYKDEFSDLVQQWNDERCSALRLALRLLYRDLEKELRNRLLDEARDGVARFCAAKVMESIRFAPYAVPRDDHDYFSGKGVRVLSIAYSTERDTVPYACVLSPDGEQLDYIKMPSLLHPSGARSFSERRVLKEAELLRLKRLILSRKPHVVAIGCESRDALGLQKDLDRMLGDLSKEKEDMPVLQVELVDTELSLVFAKSQRGKQEFPDFPITLREAVSIGRRLQDPLQEFSGAVNAEEDILCLRLHPLQDSLAKDQLLTGEECHASHIHRRGVYCTTCTSAVFVLYAFDIVRLTRRAGL